MQLPADRVPPLTSHSAYVRDEQGCALLERLLEQFPHGIVLGWLWRSIPSALNELVRIRIV